MKCNVEVNGYPNSYYMEIVEIYSKSKFQNIFLEHHYNGVLPHSSGN